MLYVMFYFFFFFFQAEDGIRDAQESRGLGDVYKRQTLDSAFCVDALEEAITKYGCPDIFNTDQGSQFTAEVFTNILRSNSIDISMDGKGRWRDNVFIERLWKSVKYEDIYLKAYASLSEVKKGLTNYFKFYNEKRWHNNFDKRTPAMVYFNTLSQKQAAA